MNALTRRRAAWHLRKLGWNTTGRARLDQAVRDFQAGYLRDPLVVDGVVGPKTLAAIITSSSYRNLKKPGGTASAHFNFAEFACKCGGRYRGCRRIVVSRDLLVGLEKLREQHYRTGLTIISGYRCPVHNRAVGGAPQSQHLTGRAADVPSRVRSDAVKTLGVFGGIGVTARTDTVAHVDTRSANRAHPITWLYN